MVTKQRAEKSVSDSWWGGDFFLLRSVQAGSGAHQFSYPVSTGGTVSGSKATGRDVHHSPPSIVGG
jgi:hypothetical protein